MNVDLDSAGQPVAGVWVVHVDTDGSQFWLPIGEQGWIHDSDGSGINLKVADGLAGWMAERRRAAVARPRYVPPPAHDERSGR